MCLTSVYRRLGEDDWAKKVFEMISWATGSDDWTAAFRWLGDKP